MIDGNAVPMDGTMVPGTVVPGTTVPGTPAPALKPATEGAAPAPRDSTSLTSATLIVSVPAEARVFVNGKLTTSTGTLRRYVSNNLEPGFTYTYELRAEMMVGGKMATESKTVKVRAGESADLAFNLDSIQDEKVAEQPARTNLTLLVPADAKVFLAGVETRSFGPVREFSTTRLANGQEWKDYTVRIEIERDGQKLVKNQTLTLVGGEARELSLDFDLADVASVARAN